MPDGKWIPDDREGLTICDATSAVFAMKLPWEKLDVVTWSWQKVMGGEGAHGMLVLSPRAIERLNTHQPAWPMPKLFRMTSGGKVSEDIFKAATINTPSMLCVEDALDGLKWAQSIGGQDALVARSEANLAVLARWVENSKDIAFLAEDENVAYDIDGYRDAPAGLRVWAGSTIEVDDLKALTKWIDWALAITASEYSK